MVGSRQRRMVAVSKVSQYGTVGSGGTIYAVSFDRLVDDASCLDREAVNENIRSDRKETNMKKLSRCWMVLLFLMTMGAGTALADPYHHHHHHYPYWFWPRIVVTPWPRYYYDPPAPVIIQTVPRYNPPEVYIQQTPPPEQGYWYYCESARAYYPYVKECPGGWMKVVPQTSPGR